MSWGRYGSIQSLVTNKNLARVKHYKLTESTVNNNAWIRDQTLKLEAERFTCSQLIPNKLQICFFSSNIFENHFQWINCHDKENICTVVQVYHFTVYKTIWYEKSCTHGTAVYTPIQVMLIPRNSWTCQNSISKLYYLAWKSRVITLKEEITIPWISFLFWES